MYNLQISINHLGDTSIIWEKGAQDKREQNNFWGKIKTSASVKHCGSNIKELGSLRLRVRSSLKFAVLIIQNAKRFKGCECFSIYLCFFLNVKMWII